MAKAKLAKKPYLEISKSLHDRLAKIGKKDVQISIHEHGKSELITKKRRPSRKKLMEFAEKTLGMWADDPEIDKAFKELEREWQQWRTEPLS